MDSQLNKDIKVMQNGIRGVYRSKRFKTKIVAIVLSIALILGVIMTIVVLNRQTWMGKVYVLPYTESFYTSYFYRVAAIERLLEERDIDKDDFEEMANVTVIPRKDLTDDIIEEYGLTGIVPTSEELEEVSHTSFVIVLLDENDNVLYYGDYRWTEVITDFVNALLESGF